MASYTMFRRKKSNSLFLKLIYKFNTILIKTQTKLFRTGFIIKPKNLKPCGSLNKTIHVQKIGEMTDESRKLTEGQTGFHMIRNKFRFYLIPVTKENL